MATKKEETTFYRFYSEIKAFLNKLLNKPIKAEPSKYLLDRGFTKDRLIRLFMNEGILKRNERIMVPGKDDVKNVQYNVKYTLINPMFGSNSETFENKLEKIHKKYFGSEKLDESVRLLEYMNLNSVSQWREGTNECVMNKSAFKDEEGMKNSILKNKQDAMVYKTRGGIKECDCGGCMAGGGDIAGATNSESSGQFVQPFGGVQRREPLLATKQKKDKDYVDPTKILGKTINEEKKMKKITFTKKQVDYILEAQGVSLDEATTTSSVGAETTRGDIGYDAPGFATKKNDKFWKDSLTHNKPGGVACGRMK